MRDNEILLVYGTSYREMAKSLLREADLSARIKDRRARIGIKPNLVSAVPASLGGTTHPEVVAGLIEYLQENGFSDICILEGSWVGDKTREAFEVCGYDEICERYQVPFIDMQKEKGVPLDCAGLSVMVGKAALGIDFLVNVPVLKGHCQTKLTCALKNMKGLLTNGEKRHFHAMGLHKPIAHLSAGIKQGFILVDGICGDLDFEDGGNPVVMNRLLAGVDPVLIDAYAASLLHYSVSEIPYIGMAAKLGVGEADLQKAVIRVLGEDQGRELPISRKVVEVSDVVSEVESCSACYGYLLPALDAIKATLPPGVPLLEALGSRICLGQGYRGQQGEIGIGNCTRGFARNLPGCPPLPEEIEAFLRDIIAERSQE